MFSNKYIYGIIIICIVLLFLFFSPSTCNGKTYYTGYKGCSTKNINNSNRYINNSNRYINNPNQNSYFFNLFH